KQVDYADEALQDREDLRDLYRVLLEEVVPLYFRRDRQGLPREWLQLVKSSLARLVPRFNTATMVSEYERNLYRPAARNGRGLRSSGGKAARGLAAWRSRVERSWPLAHVVRASRLNGGRRCEVDVFVAALKPDDLGAAVGG